MQNEILSEAQAALGLNESFKQSRRFADRRRLSKHLSQTPYELPPVAGRKCPAIEPYLTSRPRAVAKSRRTPSGFGPAG